MKGPMPAGLHRLRNAPDPGPAHDPRVFAPPEGAGEPDVWEALTRWRAMGRRIALLSVSGTHGMTPRKAGARMLLAEDGEACGTVGGGAVEQAALAAAAEMFAADEVVRDLHWQLTHELGMCCGGEMTIRIEVLEPAPALVVFGAGNIGAAVAVIARGCGFRVTVVDDRPEWAEPARLPGVTVVCRDPLEFLRATPPGARDYTVVVTHDHTLDQRLVERLMEAPLKFLGMVGSLAKQRKFVQRLRAKGFAEATLARMRSPLGVAIGASTPEEIAISVVAELIATRRGVEVGTSDAAPRRHEGSRRATRAVTAATAHTEV